MDFRAVEKKQWEIREVRKMLPERSKVVLYDTLKKDTRHRSQIFKDLDALVVLYEGKIDGRLQGHYVCLLPRATHIEYVSSMGLSPAHETTILHLDHKAFNRVLGKNYKYSRVRLQRDRYDVNTCALFCVARCYLHKWPLQKFQKFLLKKEHLQNPDDKVALLTMLHSSGN